MRAALAILVLSVWAIGVPAVGHGMRDTTKAIGHGTRDFFHGIGNGLRDGWHEATE